jgi:RHH-type rel operon transcriptional repressor/antitoxin RelB
MSTQISIRASEELISRFNALAKETDRSRAYLINQAMEEYIAREAWQVAEIRQALKEADAGDFATDEEIATFDAKWGYREG